MPEASWFQRIESIVDRKMDIIAQAKAAGTLNELDRARQYQKATPQDLLRSLNEAWLKIRRLEGANAKKDGVINELRQKLNRALTVNVVLTLVVLGLWELVKFGLPYVLGH
jgi:hypothetical protein